MTRSLCLLACALAPAAPAGCVVRVSGRYAVHARYGPQLTLSSLSPAGEYDPGQLLDGPPRELAQMESDLRELIETVQGPHLRRLLDALLGERSAAWRLSGLGPRQRVCAIGPLTHRGDSTGQPISSRRRPGDITPIG